MCGRGYIAPRRFIAVLSRQATTQRSHVGERDQVHDFENQDGLRQAQRPVGAGQSVLLRASFSMLCRVSALGCWVSPVTLQPSTCRADIDGAFAMKHAKRYLCCACEFQNCVMKPYRVSR
jgi:hypothetical protein